MNKIKMMKGINKMNKIKMIKTSYVLNTSNEFEEVEKDIKAITNEHYKNIVDAKQFFINLGGTEKHTKKNGKVVKIVSISPDNTMKSVYEFSFS